MASYGSFIRDPRFGSEEIPQLRRGLLQKIGGGFLDVFEAPQQALFSLATGRPINAAKALIPFVSSDEIKVEEVTRSENKVLNIVTSLVADPLLFVGEIGALTKSGKLLRRAKTLSTDARLFKAAGKTEQLVQTRSELAKVINSLKKIPISELQRERAVVNVGLPFTKGKDIGDLRKSINAIPIGLTPDVKALELEKIRANLLTKLSRERTRAKQFRKVGSTKQAIKSEKTITNLQKKLRAIPEVTAKRSILTTAGVEKLTKITDNLKSKFGLDKSDRVRAIEDLKKTDEALYREVVNRDAASVLEDIDSLRKAQGVEEAALIARLNFLGETRQFGAKALPEGGGILLGPRKLPDIDKKYKEIFLKEKKRADKQLGKLRKKLQAGELTKKLFQTRRAGILAKYSDNLAGIKVRKLADEQHLAKIKTEWGKTDFIADELKILNRAFADHDNMVKVANNNRIAITPFISDRISYVRRYLTPEAKKLRNAPKGSEARNKFRLAMSELNARLGAAYKRRLYPEATFSEINRIFREDLGFKFNLFEDNVIKAALKRREEHYRAISSAAAINAAVEAFARPGIKGVPIADFMRQNKLVAGAIGDLPALNPKLRVPKDIAEKVGSIDEVLSKSIFNSPRLVNFLQTIDREVNSWFRSGLTVSFPAFHHRNAVSNWILSSLEGVSNPKYWVEGARLWKRQRLGQLTKEEFKLWDKLINLRVVRAGQIEELVELGTDVATSLERLPGVGKVAKGVKQQVFRRGATYGQFWEESARIAHFLGKKAQGFTDFEAMRSVQKALIDYRDLTQFEKQIMRPLFLFYTWTRKNIPKMVALGHTNPRVLNLYQKVTGIDPDENVPDWLRKSSVIPLPDGRFITDPGLPMQDLRFFNIDDADPGFLDSSRRLVERVVSNLSPSFRFPFEVITGRSAFSRRPLSQMSTKEIVREVLPTSRLTREVKRFTDPDLPLESSLLASLSGIKAFPISRASRAAGKRDKLRKIAIQQDLAKRLGPFTIAWNKEHRELRDASGNVIQEENPRITKLKEALNKALREVRRERTNR